MESLSLDASGKSDLNSVSRSSSLIANLSRFEDETDDETKDLFVSVDDPEKHTSTLESYVTFRITTKVHGYEQNYPRVYYRIMSPVAF